MKIAIYQCQSGTHGAAANRHRIARAAARAAAGGADLLVCPELMMNGYDPHAAAGEAEAADGPFARDVADIACQESIAIAYGYAEASGGDVFNAAQLIDANGIRLADARKVHLFGAAEKSAFTPGEAFGPVATLGDWRVALAICYDIEFPETARALALAGADLIAVPTALMTPYDRIPDVLLPARAYENQVFVAYANYCGEDARLRYCGKSTLAGPDGRIIVQAHTDESLLVAELSRDALLASRHLNTYLADRRPHAYADPGRAGARPGA